MTEPALFTTEAEPAPPPPPHWASHPFATANQPAPPTPVLPAPRRVLLAALICGLLAERATRATDAGLNWAIVTIAAAIGIALVQRRPGRGALGLLLIAGLAGAALAWRSNAWLVFPNALLAIVVLSIAPTFVGRGSFWAAGPGSLIGRSLTWLEDAFATPRWAVASARAARKQPDGVAHVPTSGTDGWAPRVIGAIVATPIVGVLAMLLADADDRFATMTDPSWWGSPSWSFVLLSFFAWVGLALFRLASRPVDGPAPIAATAALSSGNVVLGAMAFTFVAFAASRLVSVTTLRERIAATRGVTWSGEARSGFFQLLAVAVITLVVVLLARVWCGVGSDRSRRTQTMLIVGNCLLVLVVVGTAVAQLLAYRDQYGWTMLRLATTGTAWWLGLVFLIIALAALSGRARSRWLTGAVIASAVLGLGIANAANPASFVATSNLERAAAGSPVELDVDYLITNLGDDALPAVADAFESLTPDQRTTIGTQVCRRRTANGWWSYRWSRRQADIAAASICD